MPGVNLDFLPASDAPEALGSPDSACAESGLEEIIGDLLVQEDVEDEDEQFYRRKSELMLQCTVREIHADLQTFGKRMDASLEKAVAQVAPLAKAYSILQEENLRLRIQQERLARQVEALCQVMGLPDPLRNELTFKESSPSNRCENKSPLRDSATSSNFQTSCDPPSCTPQDTTPEAPSNASSCIPQYSSSSSLRAISPISISQKLLSCAQDSDSSATETGTPQNSEPSPFPHPPTFATLRSLSAPCLTANSNMVRSL